MIITPNLSFGSAFYDLQNKNVDYIRLPHWQEDVKIKIHFPQKPDVMTAPYLYVESRFGCVPWNITQIEMFAKNWNTYKLIKQ